MVPRPGRFPAIWLALCVLGGVSCSSDGVVDGPGRDSEPVSSITTIVDESGGDGAGSPDIDDAPIVPAEINIFGPLGTATDLTIGWFNGQAFDENSYVEFFSEEFREAFALDDFVGVLDQIRGEGPWTLTEVLNDSGLELEAHVVNEAGDRWLLELAIDSGDEIEITGLFVSPAPLLPEVESLDAALGRLGEAGTLRFLAAETTSGRCEPVHDEGGDEAMPLGSVFKLYVLGAVVDAIDAGRIEWSTGVVIRDELDSIPSGITQDEEPGTELSVRELSERMISISDNTATDHLIELVGRRSVEGAQVVYGHGSPELNVPFLTTREFTILKFGLAPSIGLDYVRASPTERSVILDELVATSPLPQDEFVAGVTDPIEVESLEWFASPADVCRAFLRLAANADALEILTGNPGVSDDDRRWASIAFKGGSEPGLLTMAWRTETEDGRSFVIVGSVANENELLDEGALAGLFGAARDFIAPLD